MEEKISFIKKRIFDGDLKSFDESCSSDKEQFFKYLNQEDLKNSLNHQLESNENWVDKASQSATLYFIFSNESWKIPKYSTYKLPKIRLSLISPDEIPTISIEI